MAMASLGRCVHRAAMVSARSMSRHEGGRFLAASSDSCKPLSHARRFAPWGLGSGARGVGGRAGGISIANLADVAEYDKVPLYEAW